MPHHPTGAVSTKSWISFIILTKSTVTFSFAFPFTISLSRPLKKLQKQSAAPPAAAKVGNWLEKNEMVSPAEAYDSDSDDESVASTSLVVNGNRENGNGNGMDIDEEDEVESGHRGETEWTEVIPRIRDVMVDKSSRRRDAFISRNLTVSADCKFRSHNCTKVAPPPEHVPAIVSAILNALPSLEPPQVDSVIAVLVDLVNRDEKLSSEGKLKLGDKLVKWLSVEGGKAANPSRS